MSVQERWSEILLPLESVPDGTILRRQTASDLHDVFYHICRVCMLVQRANLPGGDSARLVKLTRKIETLGVAGFNGVESDGSDADADAGEHEGDDSIVINSEHLKSLIDALSEEVANFDATPRTVAELAVMRSVNEIVHQETRTRIGQFATRKH
jgi:hypothetical protein